MDRFTVGGAIWRNRLMGAVIAFALVLGVAVAWAVTTSSKAEAQQRNQPGGLIYGLLGSDRLITFTKNNPGERRSITPVTGLGAGETLIGIDFRPENGRLYGVTTDATGNGTIYIIRNRNAAATEVAQIVAGDPASDAPVTTPVPVLLVGGNFGVDFNPAVDLLRINSDDNQNLRINVDTGATAVDGPLAYTDATTAEPNIVAAAYNNNDNDPATGTVLYDIDSGADTLVRQNPANDGSLQTRGPLGINVGDTIGFDFRKGFGAVAAVMVRDGRGPSKLVKIRLGSGEARNLGRIGGAVKGIAIPGPFPAGNG